jgi:hypothetical protein
MVLVQDYVTQETATENTIPKKRTRELSNEHEDSMTKELSFLNPQGSSENNYYVNHQTMCNYK